MVDPNMATAPRGYRQTLGPKFNEGARKIWLQMRRRGWSYEDVGRATGYPRGVIYRYLWGDRRPTIAAAVKFQDVFGVDPADFARPPRRDFSPPPARAA